MDGGEDEEEVVAEGGLRWRKDILASGREGSFEYGCTEDATVDPRLTSRRHQDFVILSYGAKST